MRNTVSPTMRGTTRIAVQKRPPRERVGMPSLSIFGEMDLALIARRHPCGDRSDPERPDPAYHVDAGARESLGVAARNPSLDRISRGGVSANGAASMALRTPEPGACVRGRVR